VAGGIEEQVGGVCGAATREVATSGMEVPNATTVSPMINSLTPKAVANATAPSTSQREPNTSMARPNPMRKSWKVLLFAQPGPLPGGSRSSLFSRRFWISEKAV
jgi:hypothetical protein